MSWACCCFPPRVRRIFTAAVASPCGARMSWPMSPRAAPFQALRSISWTGRRALALRQCRKPRALPGRPRRPCPCLWRLLRLGGRPRLCRLDRPGRLAHRRRPAPPEFRRGDPAALGERPPWQYRPRRRELAEAEGGLIRQWATRAGNPGGRRALTAYGSRSAHPHHDQNRGPWGPDDERPAMDAHLWPGAGDSGVGARLVPRQPLTRPADCGRGRIALKRVMRCERRQSDHPPPQHRLFPFRHTDDGVQRSQGGSRGIVELVRDFRPRTIALGSAPCS